MSTVNFIMNAKYYGKKKKNCSRKFLKDKTSSGRMPMKQVGTSLSELD